MQTKFGSHGDCFRACLASVLDLNLRDVPDLMAEHLAGKSWMHVLRDWLKDRGMAYIEVRKRGAYAMLPDWPYLALGKSPRGVEEGHCVVMQNGLMIHDPHPDGTGLVEVEDLGFLLKQLNKRTTDA